MWDQKQSQNLCMYYVSLESNDCSWKKQCSASNVFSSMSCWNLEAISCWQWMVSFSDSRSPLVTWKKIYRPPASSTSQERIGIQSNKRYWHIRMVCACNHFIVSIALSAFQYDTRSHATKTSFIYTTTSATTHQKSVAKKSSSRWSVPAIAWLLFVSHFNFACWIFLKVEAAAMRSGMCF